MFHEPLLGEPYRELKGYPGAHERDDGDDGVGVPRDPADDGLPRALPFLWAAVVVAVAGVRHRRGRDAARSDLVTRPC